MPELFLTMLYLSIVWIIAALLVWIFHKPRYETVQGPARLKACAVITAGFIGVLGLIGGYVVRVLGLLVILAVLLIWINGIWMLAELAREARWKREDKQAAIERHRYQRQLKSDELRVGEVRWDTEQR